MIYLDGIHLSASNKEEMHRFARKFVISKSWYRVQENYYDIICPITLQQMYDYLEKINTPK